MSCRICGAELVFAGADEELDEVYWVCPNGRREDHLKAHTVDLGDDDMSDAELEAEAPGVFADPYKAAFFMSLAMVSCPKCHGVEFFTEDRIDGEVDGVCLACGHIWRVGKVELGDDEAADDAQRAVENGGYE